MITPFRRFLIVLSALLFGLSVAVVSVVPINRFAVGTRARYAAPADVVRHAELMHAGVHIVIFGLVGGVAWCVAEFTAKGGTYKLIALLMALVLGCGTEYMQHRMYDNVLEISDIRLNLFSILGVFTMLAIIGRVQRNRRAE